MLYIIVNIYTYPMFKGKILHQQRQTIAFFSGFVLIHKVFISFVLMMAESFRNSLQKKKKKQLFADI